MDSLTQQNAALVEEIAASATALNGRAAEVAESVSVFRLGRAMPRQQALGPRPWPCARRQQGGAEAAQPLRQGQPPAPAAAHPQDDRPAATEGSGRRTPVRPRPKRRPTAPKPVTSDGDWDTF